MIDAHSASQSADSNRETLIGKHHNPKSDRARNLSMQLAGEVSTRVGSLVVVLRNIGGQHNLEMLICILPSVNEIVTR